MLFTSAAKIQMHFRLHLIIEANTMNADQTTPIESIVYKQISEQMTLEWWGKGYQLSYSLLLCSYVC